MPFNERFFDGGDTFRGFAWPASARATSWRPTITGALGGTVRAIGTLQMRDSPACCPESYGVNGLSLFTDFGTMGRISTISAAAAFARARNIPASAPA